MALLLLLTGCGADPVGVESCRRIEEVRCRAATSCGLVEDEPSCQRFFRDHCLHGVALEEDPSSVEVNRCVGTLQAAGDCADEDGSETHPDDCQDEEEALDGVDAETVCELIEEPERAPSCAFLEPETTEDDEEDD